MASDNAPENSLASNETSQTTSPDYDRQGEDLKRKLRNYHLRFLTNDTAKHDNHEIKSIPLFSAAVLQHLKKYFTRYGFIAGQSSLLKQPILEDDPDPRLFFNIAAPSSVFICGSQGSGKSHTLSCLLENCPMESELSELTTPLSGLLFHYDSFTGDNIGIPCEAAHLASGGKIEVRVLELVVHFIPGSGLSIPGVQVENLRIDQADLNTQRMMDLMAVKTDDGPMPLYLHSVNRIIRELRLAQQQESEHVPFNYGKFKEMVEECRMTEAQKAPLKQRLDTLESFMPIDQIPGSKTGAWKGLSKSKKRGGTDWNVKTGQLTIVDLSCPCMTSEAASALFNMCLSLYLEQETKIGETKNGETKIGRIIALDEAHKYMSATDDPLTNTLLSTIRLQRHIGTRIFISTQEPTVSPKLLDLCSMTIVHRFSSPEWLKCLREHIAALSFADDSENESGKGKKGKVISDIVQLNAGEALLFAPEARIDGAADEVDGSGAGEGYEKGFEKLGMKYLKIKIRGRITEDGGKSVMAS
ncbi:p-loop containing nucleoside triphosphate hydrolase protein [Rutstroemia sp. NJR-2017a BBW]|nr:p-loop containing nucleoside triphosphate hydrolase protein [Rutstroemia sp. NJR-2017a BBW]